MEFSIPHKLLCHSGDPYFKTLDQGVIFMWIHVQKRKGTMTTWKIEGSTQWGYFCLRAVLVS